MKEYVEVNRTREFAHGLFPDPILRLAINAVLAQAPRADVVEADRLAVKWHPAGNPPEEGLVVLVTDGKYVGTGMYDTEDQSFSVEHGFLDPNEVLRWKSLSALLEVV